MLFFSGISPANVQQLVAQVEEGLVTAGRGREAVRLLTPVTVIAAATDEEAHERYRDYTGYVDQQAALALFAGWTGLELSQLDPDDVLGDVHIAGNRSACQALPSIEPNRRGAIAE